MLKYLPTSVLLGVSCLAISAIGISSPVNAAPCERSTACMQDVAALLSAESEAEGEPTEWSDGDSIKVRVNGRRTDTGEFDPQASASPDQKLSEVDIQVKFDGLDLKRRLNVSTVEERRTFLPGDAIKFYGSANYPGWIERAEVRIYHIEDRRRFTLARPVKVIEMPLREPHGNGQRGYAVWLAGVKRPALTKEQLGSGLTSAPVLDASRDGPKEYVYTLRVYDQAGRFDETAPLELKITDQAEKFESANDSPVPGEGEDRSLVVNIPLTGGAVTVYGKNLPEGHAVKVLGDIVPVDGNGAFVSSRILPAGQHTVTVSLVNQDTGDTTDIDREVFIPESEWFYVGLADLTIGKRIGSESELLTAADPGEYSDVYRKGRLAFYLKGKIKGQYLLTAAMDTTEEDLDEIFTNLDKKDPRQLLRRLDPDDYYPVYGDDSTIEEDAPTSGRFYVRLERGNSHVMWGNFKTRINGVEFARYERGLYGAHARLRTQTTTSFGQPVATVEGFGAQPGTLPQRDEFRGTGGSAYFLKRMDITRGSEQITIEERDRVTGLVVERRILEAGEDYDIDYVQGVIILKSPLASSSASTGAVRSSALSGNALHLVAQYEYTPAMGDVDGYSFGGRAEAWLSDHLRIGTTGFSETTGNADQTLIGADAVIRLSEKSFFEFEWAQSEGDSFGVVRSTDGGFIFNPVSANGPANGTAEAWRAKVNVDLGEATNGALAGTAGAYWEQRDAGFNAPGRYTSVDERIAGAFIDAQPSQDIALRASYDSLDRDDGSSKQEATGEIEFKADEKTAVAVGVQHSDLRSASTGSNRDGSRTDIGARITHDHNDSLQTWLFGQATVARSGNRERNDRVGVGVKTDLTDKIAASGEVSYGTSGVGAQAAIEYNPTASDRYYIGYRFDPDTTASDFTRFDPFGRDYGALVFGAKRRMNEWVDAYFEENFDFTGAQRSLTHVYGVTYTPDPLWNVGAALEAGQIYDDVNGDFDRIAISGRVGYRDEGTSASARLEARFEEGVNASTRDRQTYLLAANTVLRYDDNWRFLANIDAVISESDQSAILDGDFIEGSVGWAYRPVDNDRFNALFKYAYLHDLPGPEQVNAYNQKLGPKQRSHVLSADFIYDVTEKLSVGAKYGLRVGEVSANRTESDFTRSTAQLGILRADYHVVHNWDVVVEGRALWLKEAEQVHYGALAAVYRHLGKNAKIGLGYNFGRFSDDLTDLTWDDGGVFVNLIGKF